MCRTVIVGQSDALRGEEFLVWVAGSGAVVLEGNQSLPVYLSCAKQDLTVFSSQTWTNLSKAIPGTLLSGDNAVAVAAAALI